MVKILYGVCGEGFGHATHATTIARHLKKRGHDVLILTHGKTYELLGKEFNCVEYYDHYWIYDKNGKRRYFSTVISYIKNMIRDKEKTKKAFREIKNFDFDLVISDNNDAVCYLGYKKKVPVVNASNQIRFLRYKLPKLGRSKKYAFIAKIGYFLTMPKSDYDIALSISKLEPKRNSSYTALPIIKKEIKYLKPKNQKGVVVYVPCNNSEILNTLKEINEDFYIYGTEKSGKDKNLTFKDSGSFLKDFENCKAIISNGGFTSVGEAIFLKKPYLGIPRIRDDEQTFNSKSLEELGLGHYSKNGEKEDIIFFLKNLKKYEKNLKKYNSNQMEAVDVLDEILAKLF